MTVVYASPAWWFGFLFCLSCRTRVELLLEIQNPTKDVNWGVGEVKRKISIQALIEKI